MANDGNLWQQSAATSLLGAYALGLTVWLVLNLSGATAAAVPPWTTLPAEVLVVATLVPLAWRSGAPPMRRRAWAWLLTGCLANLSGSLLGLAPDATHGATFDALLAVLYFLDYIALSAAFLTFVAERGPLLHQRGTWLDLAALTFGLLAAQLPYILAPHLGHAQGPLTSLGVTLTYAASIAVTGATGALLFLHTDGWRADRPAMLMVAALSVSLLGDVFVNAADIQGGDPAGGVENVGYCAGYLLTALAALLEQRRAPRDEATSPEGTTYSFVPVLAVLVALVAVLGTQASRNGLSVTLAAVLALVGALLLLVRQRAVRGEFRRLNAELIARQAEARVTELVRRSVDLFLIVDGDGRVTYASPATQAVLGVAPAAVQGVPAHGLFGPANEAQLAAFLERTRQSRAGSAELELDATGAGRERRIVNVIASNESANPRLAGLTLTVRDVTEQRALERELVRMVQLERQRLCGDVHEGIGQQLFGASLLLKSLVMSPALDADALRASIAPVVQLLNETLQNVRRMARTFAPLEVVHGSLETALRALAAETRERFGVAVTAWVELTGRPLDDAGAEHVYRIAQEAINNAVRHGGGRSIDVELIGADHLLTLVVSDDGRGADRPAGEDGLGVRMMRYRARLLRGTLTVERREGGGTRVTAEIPLPADVGTIDAPRAESRPRDHG